MCAVNFILQKCVLVCMSERVWSSKFWLLQLTNTQILEDVLVTSLYEFINLSHSTVSKQELSFAGSNQVCLEPSSRKIHTTMFMTIIT
jgi:hypothetical protein